MTLSFPFVIGEDGRRSAPSLASQVPETQVVSLILSPDATMADMATSETREAGDERIIALDIVYAEPGAITSLDPFDQTEASALTGQDRPAEAPPTDPKVAELAAEIEARNGAPASLETVEAVLRQELDRRVADALRLASSEDLEKTAREGSAEAHAALGALAEAAGETSAAIEHYRAAADRGNVDAATRLGNLLATDPAGDPIEALAVWLVAAEDGDPLAGAGADALIRTLTKGEQTAARAMALAALSERKAALASARDMAALVREAAAGNEAAVEELLEAGAAPSNAALLAAMDAGQDTVVEVLLAHGANVDAVDADGRTALMRAAVRGDEDLALGLLRRGADINLRDQYGRTALTEAAWSGRPLLVALLLTLGADVNEPTNDGATPLMWASVNGHAGVIEVLIDHGARVDARDDQGATPLIRGAWNGHAEAVMTLLAAGADPRARTLDGATARSHAEAGGYEAVAALLAR